MSLFSGIECDVCGKTLAWNGASAKKHIEMWARSRGWKVGKYHRCPECSKKKLVKENDMREIK